MATTATLFLLALTGGFLFSYLCHYTSYLASRVEGQRLLFLAAAYAVLLFVLSRLTITILPLIYDDDWFSLLGCLWRPLVGPLHQDALLTFFGAFVWGPVLAGAVNLMYDADRASTEIIKEYGGELEKLLLKAMQEKALVSITLDNRKAYVGWPTYTPNLRQQAEGFRLLPAVSGYRDERTLELHFTTRYIGIYQRINRGALTNMVAEDFEVAIPLEEVTVMGPYSMEIPQAEFRVPPRLVMPREREPG